MPRVETCALFVPEGGREGRREGGREEGRKGGREKGGSEEGGSALVYDGSSFTN